MSATHRESSTRFDVAAVEEAGGCYTGGRMVAAPEQEGWIGHWSPGIGDPTLGGWLTVILYFAAASVCLWVARDLRKRKQTAPLVRRELWLWFAFSLVLWLLGLNKQLDLQTAFTEVGRILARGSGWYDRRAYVQKGFIAALGLGGVVLAALLVVLLRRLGRRVKIAAVGMCFIGVFVLIRASSFHKVDVFLGARLLYLRMNWLLEMSGILVVLLAGWSRLRMLKPRRG